MELNWTCIRKIYHPETSQLLHACVIQRDRWSSHVHILERNKTQTALQHRGSENGACFCLTALYRTLDPEAHYSTAVSATPPDYIGSFQVRVYIASREGVLRT